MTVQRQLKTLNEAIAQLRPQLPQPGTESIKLTLAERVRGVTAILFRSLADTRMPAELETLLQEIIAAEEAVSPADMPEVIAADFYERLLAAPIGDVIDRLHPWARGPLARILFAYWPMER